MSSILNTAASGLSAFQSALSVIGNNITNSTTPGYSRQTIQLVPGITQKLGNGYIGTGVALSTVVRNADQFANYQVRNTYSVKSQFDTFYQQASQIDQLLSQNGVSLSSGMQDFFTAFNQMNSNPADPAARSTVMKQSQLLASQFNNLQLQLNDYQTNSMVQIQQSVNQVNSLTTNIASLNKQLLAAPNSPDLLDQRDSLIQQLSQYMDVNVVNQENGTVSVNLSDGTSLVSGPQKMDLSVGAVRSTTFGTQIFLGENNINSVFNSGSIKGLLDFESNVVGKTSQIIGQMAIGLAQSFNEQ
ncbi:flagellar hook-associated protein FlgK [Legionella sp. km772]|uniref:flagellar hook-associated protein FlgK n=1 Tax=Legionella sp. km772 TaxID=2498111 RepID=UPI000F8E9B7A|nr:flagellar hook-associated protein FlgK [Legionella sp. km772]RUR08863.1 flagellar hook-associated protein FlgK [Legionella sp. km772]